MKSNAFNFSSGLFIGFILGLFFTIMINTNFSERYNTPIINDLVSKGHAEWCVDEKGKRSWEFIPVKELDSLTKEKVK